LNIAAIVVVVVIRAVVVVVIGSDSAMHVRVPRGTKGPTKGPRSWAKERGRGCACCQNLAMDSSAADQKKNVFDARRYVDGVTEPYYTIIV